MSSPLWASVIPVPDERPVHQFADEELFIKNSPYGNRFISSVAPWLIEPLSLITNNAVSEEVLQCCVQGGKSTFLTVAATYLTRFAPGPMMITSQTDADAKDLAKESIMPALKADKVIASRISTDKSKTGICNLSFTDMFLLIHGANLTNLQSKPIRYSLNDEVYLWGRGLLDQARKRTTRFWNRKIFIASTAGEMGSDMDLAYLDTDQRHWKLRCPECNELNPTLGSQIKWPKQEDWNWKLLRESAYFECEFCKAQLKHTDRIHKAMNAGAAYVASNTNPSPGHVGHRFNALCLPPSEYSWGDYAVEKQKAEIEYEKGNDAPRKELITKRDAQSYDPNKFVVKIQLPRIELESEWADEAYRFMTVDVQEAEFWCVVRAWARSGESRLQWAGKLLTWEEIEEKAAEFKVQPQCVFVDCSYDTQKVYLECARRNSLRIINGRQEWVGWKGLNGEAEARKSFTYKQAGKAPQNLPYSYPAKHSSGMIGLPGGKKEQRFCKWFLWSNVAIKEILIRLRNGTGAKWLAYSGVPAEWNDHMFSERRESVWDKYHKETYKFVRIGKRANHLWDCECMQVVAACMAGCIGLENPEAVESESTG